MGGITVSLDDDGVTAISGTDGEFQVTSPSAGVCAVTLSGAGVVRRETGIRVPRAAASLSLIPAGFDLPSFDEMCRNDGQLHRWTTAPRLVIIDAVLRYTTLENPRFTALPERLGEEDQAALAADLRWGLPQVTGGAFGDFASVTVESPAPGASVSFFSREGQIVLARFSGLLDSSGCAGYGRWARRGNVVVAGAIMLDRAVDATRSSYTRSLRVHELGHALGYFHVTRRPSFMNADGMIVPNQFDRDATRLAFARPPGSQSPDRDPSPTATTDAAVRGASPHAVWGPLAR